MIKAILWWQDLEGQMNSLLFKDESRHQGPLKGGKSEEAPIPALISHLFPYLPQLLDATHLPQLCSVLNFPPGLSLFISGLGSCLRGKAVTG